MFTTNDRAKPEAPTFQAIGLPPLSDLGNAARAEPKIENAASEGCFSSRPLAEPSHDEVGDEEQNGHRK